MDAHRLKSIQTIHASIDIGFGSVSRGVSPRDNSAEAQAGENGHIKRYRRPETDPGTPPDKPRRFGVELRRCLTSARSNWRLPATLLGLEVALHVGTQGRQCRKIHPQSDARVGR